MNKFETNKDNEYLLQYLQTENKTKDEIIAKATKIIESLQKEIKLSKKKAFKPEYLNENYNKKLQIPRSLKLNYKENLKNEDFSEIFETHNEMLKLQGKLEIEHKEKVILQASLEELQKKLEINENLYKKVTLLLFLSF